MTFSDKILTSLDMIRDCVAQMGAEKCYVSYSGGKDSSVLLDLVAHATPHHIPSVYIDTGLEYPEVREHATQRADVTISGDKTYEEIVTEYGYPVVSKEQSYYIYQARTTKSDKLRKKRIEGDPKTGTFCISKKYLYLLDAPFKISSKCCDYLKREPVAKYRKESGRTCVITANRSEESNLRKQWNKRYGYANYDGEKPQCCPMIYWTEQDVLRYIKLNDIEIPSVYGDIVSDTMFDFDGNEITVHYQCTGVDRTGCMYCMFGVQKESFPNRFQQMKETHPEQYRYGMEELGLDEVLTYMGVAH